MTNGEYQELIAFLGRHFTAIDQRFAAIDQRFAAIDQRFAAVDRRFDAVDRRFDAMQDHFDERFREVLGHFDELYRRLELLEQEYRMIIQGLRRIEVAIADERGRREVLERRVGELKSELAALQVRVADLEQRLRG